MTRMIPSSSSSCSMIFLPRRAASSAASLTRFARSAPVNPGVPEASVSRSISGASGLPFVCTSRILRRPMRSGRSTTIWRSKRPGRRSAGSRMSGRLVAAIRMMLSFSSKPSISTSSWFSVCSRSSWPPPRPAPRCRPTASISSMKTMHGAACLACSKRSRTREAPTPTNISTKSEPEIEKNGTPASPATARASNVFPVPGGPYSSTPLGMRAPSAWNFFGFSRNSLISCSSSTASSTPATSLKPIFGESGAIRLARLLPKLITFEPPPWTWFMRKIQKANSSTNGSSEVKKPIQDQLPVPFESYWTEALRGDVAEHSDVGEVAIPLPEIQAVADHEAIRNLEADIADGNLDLPAVGFCQERADLQGCGLAGLEVPHQVRERQAGVDDVLDHEHVAPLDVDVEILQDPDDSRGVGRCAVARDRHEVDLAGDRQLAHQVGHEEDGPLEDADQQQVAARVISGDLRAELGDPGAQRLFVDQDLADGAFELSLRHARPSPRDARRLLGRQRPRRRALRGAMPRAPSVGSWRRRTRLGSSFAGRQACRPASSLVP